MTATVIDGKAISEQVRAEVARRVQDLSARGITPGLATVLVGDDPASHVYVKSKRKRCAEIGINSWDHDLDASVSQQELLDLIAKLNDDPSVHGILVQLPLPEHIDEQLVLQAVSPDKDADGFHPANLGRILVGHELVAPATPAGIRELLVRSNIEIAGAEVVVVGRSNIVGKPIAAMLMQKGPAANATVTICHTGTRDLMEHTRRAEILIAAIGRAKAITAPMISPGVTIIDVGINRTADGLVGDVDYPACSEIAGAITPVPGGVGPMTIAMLLNNVATLAELAGS